MRTTFRGLLIGEADVPRPSRTICHDQLSGMNPCWGVSTCPMRRPALVQLARVAALACARLRRPLPLS